MRAHLSTLAAACLLAAPPAALADPDVFAELARVRAATAHYHRTAVAEADGYGPFFVCVEQPGLGAMGQHYVNGALAGDAVLDPLAPEALVYEPAADGRLELVAVEYIVFEAAWNAVHGAAGPRPALFGETFHRVDSPNRYGLPPFYALHAWVWRHNPRGMFADWNPRVRCP